MGGRLPSQRGARRRICSSPTRTERACGRLTRGTDGGDLRQLHASSLYSPVLSPDGRTLLVQTDGSPALLHLDQPPGRRSERLEAGDGVRSMAFGKWSPDGKLILGALQAADQPPMGFGV